jgi:hypothetical protein
MTIFGLHFDPKEGESMFLRYMINFYHLTLSNPIFLPPAYSPALIYFGLERGWWITCPYYMTKSIGQAPTAEWENKRNKKSVGRLPTLERNRKIIMLDEVRRIRKG